MPNEGELFFSQCVEIFVFADFFLPIPVFDSYAESWDPFFFSTDVLESIFSSGDLLRVKESTTICSSSSPLRLHFPVSN